MTIVYGIIGTAGRDKSKPMSLDLYKWMLFHMYNNTRPGSRAKSGGAAWADHLAISGFLFGHFAELTLHLPAPFEHGRFVESGYKSAGGTANYYHRLFSQIIERDTLGQIQEALSRPNCHATFEPASPGLGGMFARNSKVAVVDEMYAYTFGQGLEPDDSGTKNTWDKCLGKKTHVNLPLLYP